MLKYIFYIAILFCSLSCKKNTVNPELLLGDWEFIKVENQKDPSTVYFPSDFSFANDSIYQRNDGFFQEVIPQQEYKYLGQKSKFYVERDSLHIFSPATKKYFSQKIFKLTKDTLVLLDAEDETAFVYKKRKYENPSKINLSQITLTLGPCFGNCPVSSISIDSDGNVFYLGDINTKYKGLFKGKINTEVFSEIVTDLNKIKFAGLKNEYSIEVTDLPDISVTFIDDKKIIKTIYAYGNAEPRQLKSILNKIMYAYQDSNLKKIDYDYPLIYPIIFQNLSLLYSETFYLQTLLLNAPKTNSSFNPKYNYKTSLIIPENFNYEKYSQLERTVKTDGRYFKLQDKNNQFSTFDIVFNFLQQNYSFYQNRINSAK